MVVSSFPHVVWEQKFRDYFDKQLLVFTKFGWPIGFEGTTVPELNLSNHPSALSFDTHVDKYISKELNFKALLGKIRCVSLLMATSEPPNDQGKER